MPEKLRRYEVKRADGTTFSVVTDENNITTPTGNGNDVVDMYPCSMDHVLVDPEKRRAHLRQKLSASGVISDDLRLYIDQSVRHDKFTPAMVQYLIPQGEQVLFVPLDRLQIRYSRLGADPSVLPRVIAVQQYNTDLSDRTRTDA